MSSVLIVARKEVRQLIGSRATLFTGIGMAVFFGVMYALRIGQEGGLPIETSLGSLLFFLTTICTLPSVPNAPIPNLTR